MGWRTEPPLPLPVRAVVVGYGSIGAKHVAILRALGCDVRIVSAREGSCRPRYESVRAAIDGAPVEYVVIANDTADHVRTLHDLETSGYCGRVLLEKPVSHRPEDLSGLRLDDVYVAYQLRYDPLLIALRDALHGERLISAELRTASYLPDWRPGRDYRRTQSARLESGGGVLRDMSHELDYALWLFGPWLRVTALGGHLSGLEIETDDVNIVLAEMERCPVVSISFNYLERREERWAMINTESTTIRADIFGRTLTVGDNVVYRGTDADVAETYRAENLAMISGEIGYGCTLPEGNDVVDLIAAIELSSRERCWVGR